MGMVTGKFDYTDPVYNISVTKQISVIDIARGNDSPIVLDGTNSEDHFKKYAGMQNLIKSCVDNA